jgi:predicted aspartyl protease/tetratricopeptide (TPR) repeat protein
LVVVHLLIVSEAGHDGNNFDAGFVVDDYHNIRDFSGARGTKRHAWFGGAWMNSTSPIIVRMAAATVAAALAGAAPAAAAEGCVVGVMANLPVTMDGLRASVPLKVNGQDTNFWLDSGAFFSIMPRAKAAELGLKLEALPQGFYLVGIGGTAAAQLTRIKSFGIVGQELKNVQFLVGGTDAGNGLIGRNILALADTEFDLAGGSVKLIKPRGCKGPIGYWAPGKPVFSVPLHVGPNPVDHLFAFTVYINGSRTEAVLDSGAPTSLLSRQAAERAGIDLAGPDAAPVSRIGGLGRRTHGGWTVRVAQFAIGDEQVLRTRLTVIDGPIGGSDGPDMLLGADFMMAHHLYVARSQGRMYFTYSGGRPFFTEETRGTDIAARPAAATLPAGLRTVEAVAAAGAEPKSADEFARRGNARLTQGKVAEGIADLSAAIRLAPEAAAYHRDRAKAYLRNRQPLLARGDIDRALTLNPRDDDLLRIRAGMKLAQRDLAGALADTDAAAAATPPTSLEAVAVADLYERLHRPAQSIAIYDAVIAVHRDDSRLGSLLNGRCWVRALANVELDKALDDCTRAIKRDGAKAAFLDSRGLVRFRMGQLQAAIADLDAALKLEPQLAWSRYVRGAAKLALGQGESGRADQSAALEAEPGIAAEAAAYGLGPAAGAATASAE